MKGIYRYDRVTDRWVEAEEEKYQPNIFERIVDLMPCWVQKLVSKYFFY